MINYCIQVIVFQALFLFVYDAFLSKETFFSKNRWYLLSTSLLSFAIPLIKIPSLRESVPNEVSILLPEIVLSPQTVIEQTPLVASFSYMNLLFWLGVVLFSTLFFRKVWKLISLISSNNAEKRGKYQLIYLANSKEAFSFFNYVFIGKEIADTEKENIIQHELVHSSQRHSLDLLLFELLKIFMWFNPLVYVYQRRLSMVHEYISDEIVVKSSGKKEYMNQLINDLFDVRNIAFVNQFYIGSFVKKRIKMLAREKSKGIQQWKYLLFVPIFFSMLFYISCSEEAVANNQLQDSAVNGQLDEVVLSNRSSDQNKEDQNLMLQVQQETKDAIALKNAVPFSQIDKIPTFPGCTENDKACFNLNVQKHFATKFDVHLPKKLGLSPGKKRLLALFTVDKNGEIGGIRVKAPAPALETELRRVIQLLPKMTPGEQKGKKVSVKYTIPLVIDVE